MFRKVISYSKKDKNIDFSNMGLSIYYEYVSFTVKSESDHETNMREGFRKPIDLIWMGRETMVTIQWTKRKR